MSNVEEEVESQLSSAPPPPKPKRKTLSTAERLRIIDDFRNGIPDKYYSVDLNPRKPGEYIVRKRKTPITYEIERPVERKRPVKPEPEPGDDAPPSKTPSQLLTEPKKAFIGTEFFSMQSSRTSSVNWTRYMKSSTSLTLSSGRKGQHVRPRIKSRINKPRQLKP